MKDYYRRAAEKFRKLSDDQAKALLGAVTAENETLRSIFDSLTTGLAIADDGGRLIYANKAAERLLPSSARIGDACADGAKLWEAVDDNRVSSFLESAIRGNASASSSEFSVTARDGSVMFISLAAQSLVRGKKVAGIIITVADVTERREREVLLRRMENLAELTNLAAGMAHEIKNPLGAISIHVQLIQRAVAAARRGDGALPDKKAIEGHLDVVNEEIDSLNKKVLDFLMAARPVRARLELVDADRIVAETAAFVAPEFERYGMTVEARSKALSGADGRGGADNGSVLLIDPKLFRDTLVNMAQNSLAALRAKYPDGGKSLGKFEMKSLVKGDMYTLLVSDNGRGMSEEAAARVFEPYFTTKANGTGLGMTMAYKIIKEFGGKISVKSPENDGTVFTIAIPLPQTERKLLESSAGTTARASS